MIESGGQRFLDQGSQRDVLGAGAGLGAGEKVVSNLDGCLHMGNHICVAEIVKINEGEAVYLTPWILQSEGNSRLSVVMEPHLCEQNTALYDSINEPMFRVDSTRPIATKRVLEQFWLPEAVMWVADDVLQKQMDPR
jgi:hypothetical protein